MASKSLLRSTFTLPVLRSGILVPIQRTFTLASHIHHDASSSVPPRPSTPHFSGPGNTDSRPTSFGYQTVTESEKRQRVAGVFSSVADSYDRMNDLMSLGVHRLWKQHFVSTLNPGFTPAGEQPQAQHILDIAGGTGDIAFLHLHTAHVTNGNPNVHVTISDINGDMLEVGRERSTRLPASQQAALSFLQANAEDLTGKVPDNSVDLYTVSFGIRNFSNIPAALREAYRVLRPGGVFACLEFSKVGNPLLNGVYKRWSFSAIPLIGQLVAGDRDSYQYLVESIERFPTQEEFRRLIVNAGFDVAGQGWENLTGGIAAIHKGIKPLASREILHAQSCTRGDCNN